jgi:hypothetical protein
MSENLILLPLLFSNVFPGLQYIQYFFVFPVITREVQAVNGRNMGGGFNPENSSMKRREVFDGMQIQVLYI